jgi:LCP family protein required for cell wall assembly
MSYRPSNESNKRSSPKRSMREKKKTSPAKRVFQVLFTLVLIFAVGAVAASNFLPKLQRISLAKDDESLGIQKNTNLDLESEEVQEYLLEKGKVENILLIGVDGEGYTGVRADVMMILSISEERGMSLTSVQRDTLSYSPSIDSLDKMNHSFAYGGAPSTLKAINMNLDLDIRDFVVFDFNALQLLVDVVGGVEVDVDQAEFDDMARSGVYLSHTGVQKLNGEEALMYTRVRYGSGGDTGRNQRQREVLKYIFKEAKSLGYGQLYEMAMKVLPAVQTSYGYDDVATMLKMYQGMKGSGDFEEYSFPFEQIEATLNERYYAVPDTMRSNVVELHSILFKYDDYSPSQMVEEINRKIGDFSGFY